MFSGIHRQTANKCSTYVKPWVACFLVVSMVFCCLSDARSEIIGDKELLRLVAMANKANYEAILSWQGDCDVEQGFKAGQESHQNVWKLFFAVDRPSERYMFKASRATGGDLGGLRTRDAYHSLRPPSSEVKKTVDQNGRTLKVNLEYPRVMIGPRKSERQGDYSEYFDPFWYLQATGGPVFDFFLFLYDNSENKQMSKITVVRNASLITVTLEDAKSTMLNRYVLDLSQGGNLIEFFAEDSLVKGEHKRRFTKVANVWIPERTEAKTTQKPGE